MGLSISEIFKGVKEGFEQNQLSTEKFADLVGDRDGHTTRYEESQLNNFLYEHSFKASGVSQFYLSVSENNIQLLDSAPSAIPAGTQIIEVHPWSGNSFVYSLSVYNSDESFNAKKFYSDHKTQ